MKKLPALFKIYAFVFVVILFSCKKNTEENITPNFEEDISHVSSDPQLGAYIDNVANKIRDYIKSNPTASETELNKYLDKILKSTDVQRSSRNSEATRDMDGYISGVLNAKEQALYKSNKVKALLCMSIGKSTIEYAKMSYKSNVLYNGNGDAFRHALWNFRMTIDVGASFAKLWSDAHEYGDEQQPSKEKTMDLYNNKIGIELGKSYPNTFSITTFISKTKEKVRKGKLQILVNNRLVWSDSYGEK